MAILVGKPAPQFEVKAVHGDSIIDFSLAQFRDRQYVVLFFYPMDFTFV